MLQVDFIKVLVRPLYKFETQDQVAFHKGNGGARGGNAT